MRNHISPAFLLALTLLLAGCASRSSRQAAKPGHATAALMQQLNDYNREVAAEAAAQFVPILGTNSSTSHLALPPTDFFRLGPGDVIQVEILGEADSQSVQTVGPDGKIYYSLLPGLFVWGMTLTEAKNALEEGLAKSLKIKPEIAVTLNNPQSGKVWVLGGVNKPGVYSLANSLTVLELVSLAGGLQSLPGSTEELVDLENSFIMRKGQFLPVNFHALLRKGDLSQNIYLLPDDFIHFRPAGARQVYILGAIAMPNALDYTPGMALLTAIARAGGPAPYAHSTQVGVVRGSLSSPSVTEVNFKAISKGQLPDFKLEPGDIVYVPFRPFMKLEILGDQILRQFVQTIAANEGQRAVLRNPPPIRVSAPFGGGTAP